MSCHQRGREAEKLLDRGQIADAQRIAEAELSAHPDDAEARLVVARVYMTEMRYDEVIKIAEPLTKSPKYARRLAQAYRHTAAIAASNPIWVRAMAVYAREAAQLDPA